ncbi:DUF4157 domain-containing protein [Natrialbaceae archaeon AArc-T1-2]|uniref:eCIS core domain-containing protein n=1 Tax=Natrialbaceae archaeon AArc-T1-2 TaxID=3053904 RepID=UPI00255A9902|nr:DUF4157 domain-containing protein [Natrialbaceae archaeon AArc-T1-2]WIV66066.1 DUF4157 domain-containing protein [Natrialbaceae archaeon AArc-T1-2]
MTSERISEEASGHLDRVSNRTAAVHRAVGNQHVRRLHSELETEWKVSQESTWPSQRASNAVIDDDPERPTERSLHARETHFQPKLDMCLPNDPAEKEAERVAERVVEMERSGESQTKDPRTAGQKSGAGATLSESADRPAGGREVFGATEATVRRGVRGGGKPLPTQLRARFEARFGADFSDVNVHTNAVANEAARAIGAEAYTLGSDIAFGTGKYRPSLTSGKKLLAHELTHVVQQNGSDVNRRLVADTLHRQVSSSSSGWVVVDESIGERYPVTTHGNIVSVSLPDTTIGVHSLGALERELELHEHSYSLQRPEADQAGDLDDRSGDEDTDERTSQEEQPDRSAEPVEEETVHVLEPDGTHREVPIRQARIVSRRIKWEIRENNYAALRTAFGLYEALEDQAGFVQFISASRGGAEAPDMEKGEWALERFEMAMESAAITESHGVKSINLQNAKRLYENAEGPAQEIHDQIYEYRDNVIGGAESVADDARMVRDVSFTVNAALATGGVGAAGNAAGWSATQIAVAQAGTAGTFAAVSEGFEYSDELVANPSKEFNWRELSGRALREFFIAAITELAAGKVRDTLRATFFDSADFGAFHDSMIDVASSVDKSIGNLHVEFVRRQLVEMFADLGEDLIEQSLEGLIDGVVEAVTAEGQMISVNDGLEAFAEQFKNWNPFRALVEQRIIASFELLGFDLELEDEGVDVVDLLDV